MGTEELEATTTPSKKFSAVVSPVIFEEWKDGKGRVHEDCITHVDLVQHPVDNSQTDFVPASIACALRMGLDTGKPKTYLLADHDMADDGSKHDDDNPGEAESTDRLKNVIEALAAMKIVLPDDTTAENFFERVEAALLTAAAMGGEEIPMGTEELEATTPDFAALSLRGPFAKFASNEHRKGVALRLDALLEKGQCTPAEYKEKEMTLKSVRLSLDSAGNHRLTPTESWIDSRESVPEGTS